MTTLAAMDYRDRSTGLIVFGALEILFGVLCLLLIPLGILGQVLVSRRTGAPLMRPAIIAGLGVYGVMGIALVWLGIGSILARRWARALLLCLSAGGLCIGMLASVLVLFGTANLGQSAVRAGQPAMPPAALLVMRVVMLATVLVVYILIPGAIFLFYRSPHVKHTCEVRDPVERWTDRCPLPVLGLSLFTAFGAFGILTMLAFRGVFPLFGVIATGATGYALILVLAGIWLYFARGLYQLKVNAWWLFLAVTVIMAISSTITLWHTDMAVLNAKMGLDSRVAAMAGQTGWMNACKWMAPLWLVPWLGWLLYVRRYFPKASPIPDPGQV